jgi:threonine dehydratase
MATVTIDDIRRARERIADVVLQTPVLPFLGRDIPGGNLLWLKAESLQRTASFKLRGAYNAVASLQPEERARGVITYSSGNHGQAVACAAHLLGLQAVIVMPEDAIQLKVDATRRWGAEIIFEGHTSLDRQQRAMRMVRERSYTVIPPFDDARIIAGQGTLGLEIAEQLPGIDAVVAQVGGGGLMSGVATAIKALLPEVRVIGVEPEGGADAKESLESGSPVTWARIDTVADGLRTSRIGDLNFAAMREFVDEIVTVPDEEILQTVGIMANEAKLVVEPSGAVAAAAILFGRTGLHGKRVVAVVSGGNIEPARLQSCLEIAPTREASPTPA